MRRGHWAISLGGALALAACAVPIRPGRFKSRDGSAAFVVDKGQVVWANAAQAPTSPPPEIGPPVHLCQGRIGDGSAEVENAEISGDFLRLAVAWNGGCGQHQVDLCYPTEFDPTDPVVRLELAHKAEDNCRAPEQTDWIFPLERLRRRLSS